MHNRIKVHKKEFSIDIVEIVAGKRGATTVSKKLLPLLEALDKPAELPFLLEGIKAMEATDAMRMALVRVQVHSEQNMHKDLNLHSKRLYAAQTIEKIVFGDLCLEDGGKKKGKDKKD